MHSGRPDANRAAILDTLAALPHEAREIVAEQIVLEQQKQFQSLSGGKEWILSDLMRRGRYYAIHNDDLEVLKESAGVAAAIYAGIQNPIAIIGGLVVLLYRLRKKRILLTGNEALILRQIVDTGSNGIDLDTLVATLSPLRVGMVETLKKLANARRADNTRAPLIEEKDGRFYALDV